jgi:hypothetical protein
MVEELGRRFRAGELGAAFELFHSDFRIQQPDSLPHGGWHAGPSGMQTMSESFNRLWSRTISDPEVRGCDDTVLQMTTQTWTSRDTGRSATVDVLELFSFKDGLIKEIRVFQQDTHLLLATLGDSSA